MCVCVGGGGGGDEGREGGEREREREREERDEYNTSRGLLLLVQEHIIRLHVLQSHLSVSMH